MSSLEWTRTGHLGRLEGDFDVLVVGGGITGVGTLLDLAGRGLRVALVDQADLAHGTSSRSTKLLHGGIRYLPHMEFHLVSEGLREQKVLARIADFLFDEIEFVIPIYRQYGLADAPAWASGPNIAPMALGAGLTLYDLLGGFGRPGSRHRRVKASELLDIMPMLEQEGLRGGFVYSDASTEDARLVISVAKTAVRRFGATVVGGMRVDRLAPAAGGFTAHMTDTATGQARALHARAVVAATGAFKSPPLIGDSRGLEIVRSKGIHVLVEAEELGLGGRALVLPETDDGRVLFIVPWLGYAMVGTTDTPYGGDLAHPRAGAEDVEYLLRHVERYLAVDAPEPISTFAGLRALADGSAGSTAKASREHVLAQPAPGYVQVAGGKLTTYRRIARQAADLVAKHLGVTARSSTAEIPLVGANGHVPTIEKRLISVGVGSEAAKWMYGKYGTDSEQIARLVEEEPEMATTLSDGRTTLADVRHAALFEAADTLGDVALRRTRLSWFSPSHGREDVDLMTATMADALGWDDLTRKLQTEHFELELASEGL